MSEESYEKSTSNENLNLKQKWKNIEKANFEK